jgi:glucan phosphoethanolaminetransferase (alkaline phosphatase superfamily)
MKSKHALNAIIISIILTLITAITINFTDTWSIRNIYNTIFFAFFNLTLFMLNAFIFSKKRKYVPETLRSHLRISFIILYSLAYLLATITYATTGQIIQIQTLLFLSGIGPLKTLIFSALTISIVIAFVVWFIGKKVKLKDSKPTDLKKIKALFVIFSILLVSIFFFNTQFLKIEKGILTDQESLITYQEEVLDLELIPNITKEFDKPNVIFILLESISAKRIGLYGYERNVTPNIDLLSNKSIIFKNAYSTATHSEYAQPGLLSSRYIFNSKIRNSFDQDTPRKFIWDVFKENDYSTAYVSSQDDRWQSMNAYLNYENLDLVSNSKTDGKIDYGSGFAEKDFDHKTTDTALRWMDTTISKKEPFFLYLNLQATHNPNTYPEEFSHFKPDDGDTFPTKALDEKGINKFDNSLRYVDTQIGKIIKYLAENNLTNSTIITITSDHGHDIGARHNTPGHGNSIYNEELIVPAIAFFPDVKPSIVEEPVSHIDFVPTLIDLLGYQVPTEFQGDIMKKDRPIYFVAQSHKYMIGMLEGDIKVILDMNIKDIEVYNITADPEEKNPLPIEAHNDKILKALFWHYCQIDYYKKEKWIKNKMDRCSAHNNFKSLDSQKISYSPWDLFRN